MEDGVTELAEAIRHHTVTFEPWQGNSAGDQQEVAVYPDFARLG